METIDLSEIFKWGKKIRYLKGCKHSYELYPIKGESCIVSNLETLSNNHKEFGDKKTVEEISKMIKKLNRNYKKNERIKKNDAEELCQEILLWEDRAINHLTKKIVIEAPKGRIISYDNLILGTEGFFDENAIKRLSTIARKDFNDCCHCLLVGLATPSALMALRVLEEMLKKYYKVKTGNDPKGLEWGPMTAKIKELPVYDKDLITHLDNLRKNLRNKAMHPEKRFDIRDMEELFVTVIKTVEDLLN